LQWAYRTSYAEGAEHNSHKHRESDRAGEAQPIHVTGNKPAVNWNPGLTSGHPHRKWMVIYNRIDRATFLGPSRSAMANRRLTVTRARRNS